MIQINRDRWMMIRVKERLTDPPYYLQILYESDIEGRDCLQMR
jgi:hypothetical protein